MKYFPLGRFVRCNVVPSSRQSSDLYSRRLAIESLEDRRMLSVINWTNRNTFTGTNDNHFDEAFDNGTDHTKRDLAMSVIDAAISDWENVIANFNYVNPLTVYQLTVSMNSTGTPANPDGSFSLSAFTPPSSITYVAGGKASAATINVGWATGVTEFSDEKDGWYLDAHPHDFSDFANTSTAAGAADRTNAFFGEISGGSQDGGYKWLDLYTTVLHEIGHAVGLSNTSTLKAVATDTGVVDTKNSSGSVMPDFWRIDTAHAQALFTAGDNFQDDKGPAHYADANTSVPFGHSTIVGANALMNSRDLWNGQRVIDDTIATILGDVYGYSINLPSSFGTFYDYVDQIGRLYIKTPPGGADQVTLSVVGSNLQVDMVIGNPVPGIDPTHIVSSFALSSIISVDINTGNGADTITTTGLGYSIPIVVHAGGDIGDTLQFTGTAGVDNVTMDFGHITTPLENVYYDSNTILNIRFTTGFNTSDSLTFDNRLGTTDQAWSVRYDRLALVGGLLSVYTSPFGSLSILGGTGIDNVFLQDNRDPLQSVTIDTGDNNDIITVGYNNPFIAIRAPLTIRAGAGSDVINVKELVNVYTDGFGTTTYPILIDGGMGYNALTIDETSQNIPANYQTYDIYDNRIVMTDLSATNTDYSYDNMQAVSLQCSPNSGMVKVHSTSSDLDVGNQFTILGTPGMSTFIVYPHDAAGNPTINGNLAIGGSSSTSDNLTIDDTGSSVPTTYTFANTYGPGTTNIYGMGSAGFGAGANIETIAVKGGNGGNTFNMSSFQSGSALRVFGGGGNDTLNFGVSNLAANITSMGAFLYDGQGGSDTFNINNSGSSTALTYTQGSGLVTVTGSSPSYSLSDASVEKLVVNAGSAADTFLVNAVPSGSQTILNGNAGLDGLVLGIATTNLDAIQGVVTYNTGADAGNLAANDTAAAASDIVHLTTKSLGAASGDTLFGPGGALFFDNLVNFGSFPGITLNLGSGADTVLAEPLPSARVTINGDNPTTTPGDTLRVSLATATGAVLTPNGTGAGTYSFSNAGALNYTGFESVVAAIPGDNDLNGTVNAADYNAWRASFGSVVPRGTGSDANGNGSVDAVDYVVWRHNLGKHTSGSGAGATTSEMVAVQADTRSQTASLSRIDVSQFIAETNLSFSGVRPRGAKSLTATLVTPQLLTDGESRDEYFNQLLLQSNSGRQLPSDTGRLNNLSWSGDSMTDADVSASKEAFAAFSDSSVDPSSMLWPCCSFPIG